MTDEKTPMTEEKTPMSIAEMEAELKKEVITISRDQFIRAGADAMTDEPLNELVSKNPVMIMLFGVVQRVIWEKCVERTQPTDTTDKKEEKEDVDVGQIRS